MSWAAYQQHVQRKETSLDRQARMALNGEKQTSFESVEDFVENAPLEDFRLALKKAAQSDQEKLAAEQSQRDAEVFVKLHPEWIDSERNAFQLRAHTMATYGTEHPNLAQMQATFDVLKENGLITLNQRALAKQADNEAESRANQIRSEAFDPAENYIDLPLEEIKRRANRGY